MEVAHVKVEKPEIATCTNLREKQPKSRTVKAQKTKMNIITTKLRVLLRSEYKPVGSFYKRLYI